MQVVYVPSGDLLMLIKQVLIFDSGVGGLSVFQDVQQQNPYINYFYLFDNAYFPYGELEDDFLITRITELLLSFLATHRIDLIVIACNSASTLVLQVLREHLSIPVVGVVPAIKPAAQLSKNGVIGLLATPATIKRNYTTFLINKFAANIEVLKIGSTELVKLAEEKMAGLPFDQKCLQKILAPWLLLQKRPDTLVLGCTHFPLLKNEIANCFKNKVQLVDSGKAIANRVHQLLGEQRRGEVSNQHRAYYTKPVVTLCETQKSVALQRCFLTYGFISLDYYRV